MKMPNALDLDQSIVGVETEKWIYPGCEANGNTELWTIHGGVHSPNFSSLWPGAPIDFLMAHPKP